MQKSKSCGRRCEKFGIKPAQEGPPLCQAKPTFFKLRQRRWEKKTMPKYDVGELITALNEAVNKLNNLRVKYDDLEKERDKLRAAVQDLAKHVWRGDWDKLKPETRELLGEKE
jgi:predicted ATP-grasp superfamily ATP-dependent carboligase